MEVGLRDGAGTESIAWLYQRSAFRLTPDTHLAVLRGFMHAEAPGRYVLLGDKEEDIVHSTRSR
jgi:hypothetical protein